MSEPGTLTLTLARNMMARNIMAIDTTDSTVGSRFR
jgi:hypothetical protein